MSTVAHFLAQHLPGERIVMQWSVLIGSFFLTSFLYVHTGDGRSNKCNWRWRGSLWLLLGDPIVLLKNSPIKFHKLQGYTESSSGPKDQNRWSQPHSLCFLKVSLPLQWPKTLEAHAHVYNANFNARQDKYILPPLGAINKVQDSEIDLVFNKKQW